MARFTIRSNSRTLNRKGAPTLLRRVPVQAEAERQPDDGMTFSSGIEALDEIQEAEKVEVKIPVAVTYLYDTAEDGSRVRQRFYRTGLFAKDSGGRAHDLVIEVEPRIPKGFVVDAEKGASGILVVRATNNINVFKNTLMQPENPAKSTVKRTFLAIPEFVSFNGKALVDTNPEPEADTEEAVDEE